MCKELCSTLWYFVFIVLLAEIVLSVPQGYNYYANQQRNYYAQRAAEAQLIQAQRVAAQNRYYQRALKTTTTRRPANKINRADVENAKFAGLQNQESDEPEKPIKRNSKQFAPGYGTGIGNGCGFRKNDDQKGDGRVLWDLNVYNVYPSGGCGVGGVADVGGLGGAGLSDPNPGNYLGGYPYPNVYGGPWANPYYGYRPFGGFFRNWLGLFFPGAGYGAPYGGVNRPTNSQADSASASTTPAPNFQFLSDSEAMANLTPGQLVSGVASTLNNVFQQLSYSSPAYG